MWRGCHCRPAHPGRAPHPQHWQNLRDPAALCAAEACEGGAPAHNAHGPRVPGGQEAHPHRHGCHLQGEDRTVSLTSLPGSRPWRSTHWCGIQTRAGWTLKATVADACTGCTAQILHHLRDTDPPPPQLDIRAASLYTTAKGTERRPLPPAVSGRTVRTQFLTTAVRLMGWSGAPQTPHQREAQDPNQAKQMQPFWKRNDRRQNRLDCAHGGHGKRGLKHKRDSCEGDSLFLALAMGGHMVRNTGGLEKVKVVPADSW